MKHTKIILLSVIICLGGIIFFIISRITYESKKAEVKEKAKETFAKALDQEFKSRNLNCKILYFSDMKSTVAANIPDSVCFQDSLGKYWYKLDSKKHCMNITNDANLRFMHSTAFEKKPIIPDSLNNIWKKYLLKSDLFVNSALCISVTGRGGDIDSKSTSNSEWCISCNPMFTTYLGYACEIEIIGYLHYSIWKMMYMEALLYLLLYGVCVFIIYKISISVIVKLKSMHRKEIIEVPIIKLVQGIPDIPVRSYILNDNVLFYAEQRMIEINGIRKKMPLQACLLLELFLNSKDHIVTDTEIMNTLWPDGSGHLKRVHKAVARLRTYLITDSPIHIERENLDTYQLII
ncbi:helix-turn-helix domain-containing protein [Bacteroides sp.]|uniref:winged helix-turn-helix domain-containing protein n=1 Tax=Bacteroides sp. TaxID=29523 RepID=UPI002624CD4B|nr:helix-turn-helix domain-containing protein [Bacteroides sp.]MDD3037213.1 helix-turn-helix domain-containing protein [Bacteroides sp.]